MWLKCFISGAPLPCHARGLSSCSSVCLTSLWHARTQTRPPTKSEESSRSRNRFRRRSSGPCGRKTSGARSPRSVVEKAQQKVKHESEEIGSSRRPELPRLAVKEFVEPRHSPSNGDQLFVDNPTTHGEVNRGRRRIECSGVQRSAAG